LRIKKSGFGIVAMKMKPYSRWFALYLNFTHMKKIILFILQIFPVLGEMTSSFNLNLRKFKPRKKVKSSIYGCSTYSRADEKMAIPRIHILY
jgi:hypothetical protein